MRGDVRDTVFQHFKKLRIKTCPFANLPASGKGRWGEGLIAADMEKMYLVETCAGGCHRVCRMDAGQSSPAF